MYKRSKIRDKSLKKIYVGKGNLKHTNNKVIITLFTYNTPKLFLLRNIRQLIWSFFSPRRDAYYHNRKKILLLPSAITKYLSTTKIIKQKAEFSI
jgi:hypothetical protein